MYTASHNKRIIPDLFDFSCSTWSYVPHRSRAPISNRANDAHYSTYRNSLPDLFKMFAWFKKRKEIKKEIKKNQEENNNKASVS